MIIPQKVRENLIELNKTIQQLQNIQQNKAWFVEM